MPLHFVSVFLYLSPNLIHGLLEYPQYTRPYDFKGLKVPDVLLSGNHKEVDRYNLMQSIKLTQKLRPDMFEKLDINDFDDKEIRDLILQLRKGGHYERY